MIKLRTFFYQIENIFCLKISGGGVAPPPESVRGGECPLAPPPVTAFGPLSNIIMLYCFGF